MPVAQSALLKKRWYPKDTSMYKKNTNKQLPKRGKQKLISNYFFFSLEKKFIKICQPISVQYILKPHNILQIDKNNNFLQKDNAAPHYFFWFV
jgi:hypothetical protein